MPLNDTANQDDLHALLALGQQARAATTAQELAFLLANVSHTLTPYRQAVFWLAEQGAHTLSGVVQIEANAPYVQWVNQVCQHLSQQPEEPALQVVRAADLPSALAADWHAWWPTYALWVRLPQGAVVLLRDDPWTAREQWLWQEWSATWAHAWHALVHPRATGWRRIRQRVSQLWQTHPDRRWWQQTRVRVLAGVLAVLLCPVQLTVLAPGELVPSQPVVIRAPLEGVIDTFYVQPNQFVTNGTPLFGFDEALIRSRLDVANQALSTAETEYRQTSQQALTDARYKTQLALLTGKIEEKRAEVDYLAEQLARARVLAPRDGIVLMDDPTEWIGRPVIVGERILRIAAPNDVEVEAWVPLADAIPLPAGATVKLYLHASPLSPVEATVRYMAHDAVARPDGQYAYRMRARLSAPTAHRVGLKGSAKLSAGWQPLGYWVLRRPLAALRTTFGI